MGEEVVFGDFVWEWGGFYRMWLLVDVWSIMFQSDKQRDVYAKYVPIYYVVRKAERQDFSEILKGIMKEDSLTPSPRTPVVRAGLHKRSVYYG